jgi:N-glycosylase/DNA lyase
VRRVTSERLTHAVAMVCADIAARVECRSPDVTERGLWWELSCCLLSSQVPFALATAAAVAIDESGLLRQWDDRETELVADLTSLLTKPLQVEDRLRFYRFPKSRARQLAAARSVVAREASGLSDLLAKFTDAIQARDWFVQHTPGIGPKQASMFLRNIGVSYDLAVLDRHVLTYMATLGLADPSVVHVSGMRQYCRHEATLRAHAACLGHPVGLLDWAIWIVMRVVRDLRQETLPA